jgi:hypothetical protein
MLIKNTRFIIHTIVIVIINPRFGLNKVLIQITAQILRTIPERSYLRRVGGECPPRKVRLTPYGSAISY